MTYFKRAQSGFTLALALVFAGVLGATLASLSFVQNSENIRREAEIAGVEGAQIARAARIFARNQFITRPNLVNDLASAPEEITVGDLIAESLLPENFARENAGQYFNALGQRIRIFQANHPIAGDPALETTVPTAYVIFEDTPRTDPDILQNVVQSIRAQDVSISTPLFSGTTNLTGACNGGGDTVAIWETGCLDTTDYTNLTGDAFIPGTFVIPAWRTVNFDTLAFIRFPQPEQTGLQTMFTDLEMANMQDCDADDDGVLDQNLISVTTNTGNVDLGLCDAVDDVGVNNRRDILNVNEVSGTSAILVDPQVGAELRTDGVTEPTSDILIQNDLTLTRGNAIVFDGITNVTNNVIADRNIAVTRAPGAITFGAAIVEGTLTTGDATFNNARVSQTLSGNRVNISSEMRNTSSMAATNSFTGQQLTRDTSSTPRDIIIDNNASIGTNFDVDSLNITGNSSIGGYSYITGNLSAAEMAIGNDLTVNSSVDIGGQITADSIDVTDGGNNARCIGDCPRRVVLKQCENAILFNLTPLTLTQCIQNGGP